MKQNLHPEYHYLDVECVCGAQWKTRSTVQFKKVDICSACHPFYTGNQKVMDTEGRIEKFKKKYATKPVASAKKK
ncbi:MAG: 50S ribosomal protein L31 [Bacteriovoracaceae bacterium]|nr:50S ribosomal protein L31 [Bacteriovoracaceae bacterium]